MRLQCDVRENLLSQGYAEKMTAAKKTNSKKLSILWVSFFLDNNPALCNILNQLSEMGHSLSLISVQTKNPLPTNSLKVRAILAPLKHVSLFSPVMFAILLFFCLPIRIVASKANVVVMEPYPQILSTFPSLLISRLRKVKFILDIRTTPVETQGFRGFLTRFWFSVSVLVAKRFFGGVTIITPMMKKEVCNHFKVDPAGVGVWTSGVSDTLFNPANVVTKVAELRRESGMTGKFVVFYHGAFGATRRLPEVIKAVGILKQKYPDIVLFLLGSGPIIADLKAFVNTEDTQNNVIFHNPVNHSEVPKFIGMSDVCIVPLPNHPYWRYQSPLKLLEYLAMEKVVILTDIPAHRAVVREAKCGIFISSIKPIEIAKTIEYVYQNKVHLKEWGKIGRDIVQREYTWEKVAKSLEDYLLSIVELSKK
jgi:glycosyltransferase involved in cell wall biosynthesis